MKEKTQDLIVTTINGKEYLLLNRNLFSNCLNISYLDIMTGKHNNSKEIYKLREQINGHLQNTGILIVQQKSELDYNPVPVDKISFFSDSDVWNLNLLNIGFHPLFIAIPVTKSNDSYEFAITMQKYKTNTNMLDNFFHAVKSYINQHVKKHQGATHHLTTYKFTLQNPGTNESKVQQQPAEEVKTNEEKVVSIDGKLYLQLNQKVLLDFIKNGNNFLQDPEKIKIIEKSLQESGVVIRKNQDHKTSTEGFFLDDNTQSPFWLLPVTQETSNSYTFRIKAYDAPEVEALISELQEYLKLSNISASIDSKKEMVSRVICTTPDHTNEPEVQQQAAKIEDSIVTINENEYLLLNRKLFSEFLYISYNVLDPERFGFTEQVKKALEGIDDYLKTIEIVIVENKNELYTKVDNISYFAAFDNFKGIITADSIRFYSLFTAIPLKKTGGHYEFRGIITPNSLHDYDTSNKFFKAVNNYLSRDVSTSQGTTSNLTTYKFNFKIPESAVTQQDSESVKTDEKKVEQVVLIDNRLYLKLDQEGLIQFLKTKYTDFHDAEKVKIIEKLLQESGVVIQKNDGSAIDGPFLCLGDNKSSSLLLPLTNEASNSYAFRIKEYGTTATSFISTLQQHLKEINPDISPSIGSKKEVIYKLTCTDSNHTDEPKVQQQAAEKVETSEKLYLIVDKKKFSELLSKQKTQIEEYLKSEVKILKMNKDSAGDKKTADYHLYSGDVSYLDSSQQQLEENLLVAIPVRKNGIFYEFHSNQKNKIMKSLMDALIEYLKQNYMSISIKEDKSSSEIYTIISFTKDQAVAQDTQEEVAKNMPHNMQKHILQLISDYYIDDIGPQVSIIGESDIISHS